MVLAGAARRPSDELTSMLRAIKMPVSPPATLLPTISLPATPPALSPSRVTYIGGFADALEPLGLASGYFDEDGDMGKIKMSVENHQAATRYLRDRFGVDEFYICGIFAVLLCNNDTAIREGRLPILIGGLSALWREEQDGDFPPILGDPAYGGRITVDESLVTIPERLKPPKDQTIEQLATYIFTDCEAMTWINSCLIVELPKTDRDEYLDRLNDLPGRFTNVPWAIQYHNGQLAQHEQRKRVIIPTPQRTEDDRNADETDYVNLDGKFYPGSMLYSIDDSDDRAVSEVTAGVLVRKGTERRLTCAWHAWAHIYEKNKNLLGEDTDEAKHVFRVIQGTNPGTNVGYVKERIGKTDIALIQLHDGVRFENTFLGGSVSAKRFIHSDNVNDNDIFLIDGFTTGKQEIATAGTRFPLSRPDRLAILQGKGKDDSEDNLNLLPEPNVAYITRRQGVSATQMPKLRRKPFIRDGVCGAVWLRISVAKSGGGKQGDDSMMEKGEVFAMCHYADLTSKYSPDSGLYLMHADTFDPLIKENWTIVPVEGVAEELNTPPNPRPTTEESPSKRLRPR
ncbi:hypothetical protein B0T25DRAFT_522928 [Lasiosphaeria hispida]|uniref:Uncharacterized protein n=1 Tax=Lasiosphaeria hispida TaxID=260671 RepID=A0AAJ0H6V2_9PEZI|nr:hypothetical protein B0T25DRAFT_522928 [Lasiosphaeria hispida]